MLCRLLTSIMPSRRKVLIATFAAMLVVAFIAYAITVLRTCSEAHDIARDSYEYRLCGFKDEFITRIPVTLPINDALFSWRDADGTKPSRRWLRYRSTQTTAQVHQTLKAFLQSNSFQLLRNEDGCEWWGDGKTELCITIGNEQSQNIANVEIFHVIP